ncbi:MAG: hypothetical protein WC580_01055 [Agrococcus sp.]
MEDGRQRVLRSGGRAALGSIGPIAATLGLHFVVAATLTWAIAPVIAQTYAWRPFSILDLRALVGAWGALAGPATMTWALLAVAGAALLGRRSARWLVGSAAIVAVASAVAVGATPADGIAAPAAGAALAALLLVPASATATLVSRALRRRSAALA